MQRSQHATKQAFDQTINSRDVLRIEGISKHFGGLQALKGVSVAVERPQIVGVIGPNGAGKTTFFNVITGFIQPDEGRVQFKSQDVTGLPPHQICRRGIARTFQITKPFGALRAVENVMLGAFCRERTVRAAREKARQVLRDLGLLAMANREAAALNVGEKKLLEVARAMATDPELLLLDEPMAGLTKREIHVLLKTIETIRQRGITVLLVEHVVGAVMAVAERVVVLDFGEVIADGSSDVVRRDPAVIKAYLGRERA